MSGIIWLASYPKSGNTWLRLFLANLIGGGDEPVSINELGFTPLASERALFDNATGLESSNLTHEEIDRVRPAVYDLLAAESEGPVFVKIHDASSATPGGEPIISRSATLAAIYIVRNPLDVAVSFAHHSGWSFDGAIDRMANKQFALSNYSNRLNPQLRQRLLTWSGHVLSWIDSPGLKVHILRYEDMKQRPIEAFSKVIRFAGLSHDRTSIERAVRFSDFAEARQQENTVGFRERFPKATSFFRRGAVGSWKESLTREQASRIVTDHKHVMRRLGYLDEEDRIVFQ